MLLVMHGWMVFSVVISHVVFTGAPIKMIFILEFSVSQPIKTHVHSACFSLFDGVGYDAARGSIVSLNGGWGCRVRRRRRRELVDG